MTTFPPPFPLDSKSYFEGDFFQSCVKEAVYSASTDQHPGGVIIPEEYFYNISMEEEYCLGSIEIPILEQQNSIDKEESLTLSACASLAPSCKPTNGRFAVKDGKEFRFSAKVNHIKVRWRLLFQFIDPNGYVNCDFCKINITRNRLRNRIYVFSSSDKIMCAHTKCLSQIGFIKSDQKLFLKNLFCSLSVRPAPAVWIRQLNNAGMLDKVYLLFREKCIQIVANLTEEDAAVSFEKIVKDAASLASPQLILCAYQKKVLSYKNTLYYLHRVYKNNDEKTALKLYDINVEIINKIEKIKVNSPSKIKEKEPKK